MPLFGYLLKAEKIDQRLAHEYHLKLVVRQVQLELLIGGAAKRHIDIVDLPGFAANFSKLGCGLHLIEHGAPQSNNLLGCLQSIIRDAHLAYGAQYGLRRL